MDILVVLNRQAKATGLASDNKNFLTLRKMFNGAGSDIQDILGSIPHPIAQGASAFFDMFGSGQGVPATMGVPNRAAVVRSEFPARRMVSSPRIVGRNSTNAPVGQGPFAGITYPQKTTKKQTMANVSTNYGPVTTKTLKNRRKREKAKIKRSIMMTL